MARHGEAQGSCHHPVCHLTVASQRRRDASSHAADLARDGPVGYPQRLAHEGTEGRRSAVDLVVEGGSQKLLTAFLDRMRDLSRFENLDSRHNG